MMSRIRQIFLIVLLFNVYQKCCLADCVLNANINLYLQPFGQDRLILPNGVFNNNQNITIYCPGGFEHSVEEYNRYNGGYEYRKTELPNVLKVRCKDQSITSDSYKIDFSQGFSCKRSSWNTAEVTSSTCSKNSSYVVGFEIDDFKVIFAEICLNAKDLHLDYIHFVAGQRTPLLSRHVELNPLSISEKLIENFDTNLNPYFMTSAELGENIVNSFNSSTIKFKYEFKELVPSWNFQSYYESPLDSFNIANNAIFWDQLRDGNWKKFEDDLRARSEKHEYDVYMGTSDIAPGVPSNGICDIETNLTFKADRKFTQSVPKLIWAYLKQRNDNKSDSDNFVVVAVNTPYLESFTTSSDIFCEDICDQIDWLKSLKVTRKMSALGYTFCCAYHENLVQRLNGFPKVFSQVASLAEDGNTDVPIN